MFSMGDGLGSIPSIIKKRKEKRKDKTRQRQTDRQGQAWRG